VLDAIIRRIHPATNLIRGSTAATYAYLFATDRANALLYSLGHIATNSGATHASLSVEESLAYITGVFDDYKRYSEVNTFHGRVAEIGPGDNCGVALMFLADGCDQVDLLDRFYSRRDDQQQSRIYQKLLELRPELRMRRRNVSTFEESTFDGVHRYYGKEASAENFFLSHGPYNFIVSRATLEHVSDPCAALSSMASALASGGMLLHKVDLGDHGMFSPEFHELKFLEVPEWCYSMMTRASGRPNRVLGDKYCALLRKANLQFSILVTRLAGVGDITPHRPYEEIPTELRQKSLTYIRSVRPRLARRFRSISDEVLSVTGFFLIAKRRAGGDCDRRPE
jgi:hypothetical protein